MANIDGMAKHLRRLRRMTTVDRVTQDALYKAGRKIELTAEASIKEGGIPSPNHIPSQPGQPPNADTHHLDRNIRTAKAPETAQGVSVISDAEYAKFLEFGTRSMAARPYMKPAAQKHRKDAADLVGKAVRAKIKGSGS